jgi:YegS/Rv2252/BmrU family lipid kinase
MSVTRETSERTPIERVLIVENPVSRLGAKSLPRVTRVLSEFDIDFDVAVTERSGHAAAIASDRAADYDAVFSLGGDGTAVEIIGATLGRGIRIGVLPGGTGNLLARALGISMNMSRAVRSLVAGAETWSDVGRLGDGTPFIIGVGAGIDAAMIAGTPARWKRRLGILAYAATGCYYLFRRRHFEVTVTADGSTISRRASVVLVANYGVLLNGLVTLGPEVRPDDGRLDVCIFDPATVTDIVRVAAKLMFRDFTEDASMSYIRGRQIEVATVPALAAQADGELIGSTPFLATVETLGARLLMPAVK